MSEEEFRSRYEALMAYGRIEKAVYETVYAKMNNCNAKVEELIEKL